MATVGPFPSVVHRIQRRYNVARSPCTLEHVATKPVTLPDESPFTHPTVHMWSLRVGDSDRPHVVIFADAEDARATTRAITSFTRKMHREPKSDIDLVSLFQSHFRHYSRPSKALRTFDVTSAMMSASALHTAPVGLDDVIQWTLSRHIGIIAIPKIPRSKSGPPDVHFSVAMVEDDLPEEINSDVFHEDFAWQLMSPTVDGEGV